MRLIWWGLEIDKRPLEIGLNMPLFRGAWSMDILEILDSMLKKNSWKSKVGEGQIIWGDARE